VQHRAALTARAAGNTRDDPVDCRTQIVESLPRRGRAADHLKARQELRRFLHRRVWVDQVALAHRDDAVMDAEHVEDARVLDGLWHHAIVGCNDHQEQVYPGRA
jgi:hypothetical protein